MSKPKLHLLGTVDAQSLAKLYESMTGKRPSPAEIEAAQKVLGKPSVNVKPRVKS